MKKYIVPEIEIEEVSSEDIMSISSDSVNVISAPEGCDVKFEIGKDGGADGSANVSGLQ